LIFEETYKDFYLSLDAIENVKRFWKCCEELGKSLQKESTQNLNPRKLQILQNYESYY